MSNEKNRCFGLFYQEILDAVFNDLENGLAPPAAASLMSELAGRIHDFDNFIDKSGLSPHEARLKAFTPAVMEKIVKRINNLFSIGFDQKDLDRHLDCIADYFEVEIACREDAPTKAMIKNIFYEGNCDFYFYNEVIYAYIISIFGDQGELLVKHLNQSMVHYLALDLLLDHICDIDEDVEEGSFNVLLWTAFNAGYDALPDKLHSVLWEKGIFHQFYRLATHYAGRGIAALRAVKPYPKVYRLMGRYLAGEMNGLRVFMQNKGYYTLAPDLRSRFTHSDLKPYPWSQEPLLDVRKEIIEVNKKLIEEKRAVIAIGGNCEYSKCTHCGLSRGVADTGLKDFEKDLKAVDFKTIDTLCLYTAGSFFKPDLDPLRDPILEAVAKTPVQRIMIESRPEGVKKASLEAMIATLPGKILEIGLGLDHKNNQYRNEYLNKAISLAAYEKAIGLLKGYPVKSCTYVAVGGPYLSEKEAYLSAVETALYASKLGSDIVSFEPMVLQKNTLQEKLYHLGKMALVSKETLDRIIEKVQPIAEEYDTEIRIGGTVQPG